MGSPLRALIRVVLYFGWTAALLPLQALAVVFDRPAAKRIPLMYHRNVCRLLGIRVAVKGEISRAAPTLFVFNHSSYLDIEVVGSLVEGSFVSKAEVANWPLFGLLAKLQRTVFIDRRAARAKAHGDEIGRRLAAGDNLFLFPEGTSTDGNRVRPFRSSLFVVAEREVDGKPLPVQPVSIAYTRLDGIPLGRALRPLFTWFGDMDMLGHMWTMLGLGHLTVEVQFHKPVSFADYGSRKALAQACHEAVSVGHAALIAGPGPQPRKRRLVPRRPVPPEPA
jgi:1-acyl-sn-glycerol-3-phosphate acyltransferase